MFGAWRQKFDLDPNTVTPAPAAVLKVMGIPPRGMSDPRLAGLYQDACGLLAELIKPVGLVQEVTRTEFTQIFTGLGQNDPANPLADIFPRAENLALFAATLGQPVGDRISALFAAREFALAAMLDAAASAAADQTAAVLESCYGTTRSDNGSATSAAVPLRYSPGYCGWHVSGQQALFAVLKPAEIGLTLRESFLMEPLKSVSGVIVTGPAEIHSFADEFPCCDDCVERGCRSRIKQATLKAKPRK
jgi:hypothetical protein